MVVRQARLSLLSKLPSSTMIVATPPLACLRKMRHIFTHVRKILSGHGREIRVGKQNRLYRYQLDEKYRKAMQALEREINGHSYR